MATTDIDLYRSVRKEDFPEGVVVDGHAVTGVLYPTFEPTTYQTVVRGNVETRTRRADVTPYPYNGQPVVDPGGGTSLFNKANVFGTKYWWNFKIPAGTVVPASLRIRFTGHNDTYKADHYQIEAAAHRMAVVAFKGALDNLARNAIVRSCETAGR
jgi:hypothetical protein